MSVAWVSMLSELEYESTSTSSPERLVDCSNFTVAVAW